VKRQATARASLRTRRSGRPKGHKRDTIAPGGRGPSQRQLPRSSAPSVDGKGIKPVNRVYASGRSIIRLRVCRLRPRVGALRPQVAVRARLKDGCWPPSGACSHGHPRGRSRAAQVSPDATIPSLATNDYAAAHPRRHQQQGRTKQQPYVTAGDRRTDRNTGWEFPTWVSTHRVKWAGYGCSDQAHRRLQHGLRRWGPIRKILLSESARWSLIRMATCSGMAGAGRYDVDTFSI